MYIGNIGDRLNIQVEVTGVYKYEKPAFNGWDIDTHRIYIMVDGEGNTYKWDTTKFLIKEDNASVERGDVLEIKGTVKAHAEYREVEQTCLNRVKLVKTIHDATADRIAREEQAEKERADKVQAQKDSIEVGDEVIRMAYRQYKNHYADCETVIDSYRNSDHTIEVIVREGRMKVSGVRGKKMLGFKLQNNKGETVAYRATCAENAIKHAIREFGDEGWEWIDTYACRYV